MRRRWLAMGMTGLAAAVLAACVPVTLLNLVVPRFGYRIVRDVAYGTDPRQKLDLYVPNHLPANASVLLFFYGGSWQSGSKGEYLAFGQAFASEGIVVAIADYRLYPQVHYPAFVQDGAAALRFVHANIAQYGGRPDRIFLAGHSAGAYIAAMLAADRRYLHDAGAKPTWIRGVIGIAGPYDFLPLQDRELIDIFGGAARADTQPINYIDSERPPMLLVAGADDETVSPGNTTRLAAKLASYGSPVQQIIYPGVGHIGIILSLAIGFRRMTTLRHDMIRFVETH